SRDVIRHSRSFVLGCVFVVPRSLCLNRRITFHRNCHLGRQYCLYSIGIEHNGGACVSFADGDTEARHWSDPRTRPPIAFGPPGRPPHTHTTPTFTGSRPTPRAASDMTCCPVPHFPKSYLPLCPRKSPVFHEHSYAKNSKTLLPSRCLHRRGRPFE